MTYTKEEARTKIAKLVEDFRAHEATLEKAAEAQIENNFIRPLFRYLNWNTENEGLSHAHYEFKVQVTNKKGLRPDYILNLDGRDVLVIDAKRAAREAPQRPVVCFVKRCCALKYLPIASQRSSI